jgi:septum formation protein
MSGKEKWILASQSPRRKEILKEQQVDFDIEVHPANEYFDPNLDLDAALLQVAAAKAAPLADKYPDRYVLSADTIVVFEGKILGKPADEKEAAKTLRALSGKEHLVKTGVVLQKGKERKEQVVATKVFFRNLSDTEIDAYVKSGRCMDKAGSYGIQETDFVEKIDGSYTNVVGLPAELIAKWKEQTEAV